MPPIPKLSVLLLLPLAACAAGHRVRAVASEMFELTLPLSQPRPDELRVQYYDGLLILRPGESLSGRLRANLVAEDLAGLSALRSEIRPTIAEADGRTDLSVALPEGVPIDSMQTVFDLAVPASTRVLAETRCGGAAVRGFRGNLEVRGGIGDLEVDMNGGSARLKTGRGAVRLRGIYRAAQIESESGRIEVAFPPGGISPIIGIRSTSGPVFLDLWRGQNIEVRFRGDVERVRADADVRVSWREIVERDGKDEHLGTFGDPNEPQDVKLELETGASVTLRLCPDS